MSTTKKSGNFSGQLGFVLASAASAIGVGNLWRFPYLVAKDGGGVFLFIYLVLVLTFGYSLLMTDIVIGRRTKCSAVHAYEKISKKWKPLGIIIFCVPAIILAYYAVIGGWITKYFAAFLVGQGEQAAADGFFGSFITSSWSPVIFSAVFLAATSLIIYLGVEKGIEKAATFIMPVLLLTIIGVAGFALTLVHTDASGVTRTGWEGFLFYITPDFTGMTMGRLLQITLDAMSQLFFSLSVSMGIMITYGSYARPEVDLSKSASHIEIFDTLAAVLIGIMIIPAIYVFSGTEGMGAGPSLMFISLPKIFAAMGPSGVYVGVAFFAMATLAALTSSVSIMEPVVADCMDLFKSGRNKTVASLTAFYMAAAAIVALGYSVLYIELPLPNGSVGQILDVLDYISNCLMMPFASLMTCLFIGWVVGPQWIIEEVETYGNRFGRKLVYRVMMKYVAPVLLFILFLDSTGLMKLFW